jgi:hypothetical protein
VVNEEHMVPVQSVVSAGIHSLLWLDDPRLYLPAKARARLAHFQQFENRPGLGPTETNQLAPRRIDMTKKLIPLLQRQRLLWQKQVVELLRRLGAKLEGGMYPWHLETPAGLLRISVEPNTDRLVEGLGSLRMIFDDSTQTQVRCNSYGEWDIHYYGGWTVETSLRHLEQQLKRVAAFRIRVFQEDGDPVDYTIVADSETDARVIAFCLDGGHVGTEIERGHIELAKTHTEAI